jgi:hypothetical protein
MNAEEARDRFRSAARKGGSPAPDSTLDAAKQKLRSAAAELDDSLGLNKQESGVWAAALFFFALLLGTGKTQSWIVPLVTGLSSFGGKAFDTVVGMFEKKSKEKNPRQTKRTIKK